MNLLFSTATSAFSCWGVRRGPLPPVMSYSIWENIAMQNTRLRLPKNCANTDMYTYTLYMYRYLFVFVCYTVSVWWKMQVYYCNINHYSKYTVHIFGLHACLQNIWMTEDTVVFPTFGWILRPALTIVRT